MKILFISNGSGLSDVKSGGVTRLIELMRQFARQGSDVNIMTTIGGYRLFQREAVKGTFHVVKAAIFRRTETNNIQRAISYVISTVHAVLVLSYKQNFEAIYSSSDYFCDVIPAVYGKLLRPNTKYFAMIHHLAKRSSISRKNSVVNKVSVVGQGLSLRLIAHFADTVFLYGNKEGESIRKKLQEINPVRIDYVNNGVDLNLINRSTRLPGHFEACFVGGLRASKGIFDLIEIWKRVVDVLPTARVIVIGAGTRATLAQVESKVSEYQLKSNVSLVGEMKGAELYGLIKSSTMLIAPSHEEGWGISICEALACDLAVVAYDLEVYSFLGNSITKVPMSNFDFFASEVVSHLTKSRTAHPNSHFNEKIRPEINWETITKKEYQIISSLTDTENG